MRFGDFEYEVKYGLVKITSYLGDAETVKIPEKISKYNVYTIGNSAFLSIDTLKEVILPKSIGKIEENAFFHCKNLKRIEIGIVEEIENPFVDCSQDLLIETSSPRMANRLQKMNSSLRVFCEKDLKIVVTNEKKKECCLNSIKLRLDEVCIPDRINGYKVTSLGFSLSDYPQKSFKCVYLPKYLKEIPERFFYELSVDEIKLGSDIKTIGKGAFNNLKTTKDFVIPKSVKVIGSHAFSGFNKNLKFRKGIAIESIGEGAFIQTHVDATNIGDVPLADAIFYGATVNSLSLTESMETIPQYAFAKATLINFSGLEKITEICSGAFAEAKVDDGVEFDLSNVERVGEESFRGSNFTKFFIPKHLKLRSKLFNASKAYEIVFADDYEEVKIPENCFSSTSNLTAMKLPESIREIDMLAFTRSLLSEINLENIQSIGESAFRSTLITDMHFGENLVEVKPSAFAFMGSLKTVTFDDNCPLRRIPDSCFSNTTALEKVTLSKNLQIIGSNAFENSCIKEINLENVKDIGVCGFSSSGIRKADLSNLEIVRKYAFKESFVKEVKFSSKLKVIAEDAFGRSNLTKVTFPEGLETIGDGAFYGTNIKSLVIPDSVKVIENYAFTDCDNLREVKIGKGLKKLNRSVFHWSPVESIDLGNLEELDYNSLGSLRIKELIIPESVKYLREDCIQRCYYLEKVVIKGTIEELELGVFENCKSLTEIHTNDKKTGKKLVARKNNYITKVIPIT